jgi:hypothetical protein
MFSIAPRYAGAHALEGILIAAGPHILVGQQTGLHIADLAPTTLYALGLPIPEAMDGKVQTGIFSPAHIMANPVYYNDLNIHAAGKTGQVMTDEDEAKVETRLRDLGYL